MSKNHYALSPNGGRILSPYGHPVSEQHAVNVINSHADRIAAYEARLTLAESLLRYVEDDDLKRFMSPSLYARIQAFNAGGGK